MRISDWSSDVCSSDLEDSNLAIDEEQLETDLRLALHRGEIGIVFQPQYAMTDDRLTGVEALARWNHPKLGLLGAAALFAAAERSDYLLPLSSHLQQRALEIGRASCRDRVCQYVLIAGVDV